MIAKVLGPLRATLDGVSIVPTAPMARRVLALLVLDQGRVVRIGTIERELWGADPPRSAATSVQNQVMRIRRAMDGSSPPTGTARSTVARELLTTEPTGYRLEAPEGQFDIESYRLLVGQAEQAECVGQLTQASAVLKSALALWHDTPLSDLATGSVLQARVLRLEEERRSGLLRRISLDLRMRRHSEIIGELRELTGLDPYDELLHEYLMFALYFSGRRNDALSTYQGFRTALAEGVGLEPSPRLRELQQAILMADDTLGHAFLDPTPLDAGSAAAR